MDLFSQDSPWLAEMEKISKVQAKLIRENLEKINAVRGAVKRPEAARKMGVDVSNPDSIRNAIETLLVENSRIANPDGAMLQQIRSAAGLNPIAGKVEGKVVKSSSGEDVSAMKSNNWYSSNLKKFGSVIKNRIEQFKVELLNRKLNDEEQGIYDVTTGKKRGYEIQTKDLENLGDVVTYLIGDRHKGAKKILFKHYGSTNRGPLSAEEILQVGRIIRDNHPRLEDGGNTRIYEEIAPDSARLRVVVGKDKKNKRYNNIDVFK